MEAGFTGIIPTLQPKVKAPVVAGYTGYDAIEPSSADAMGWKLDYPDSNIVWHLPDWIVGLDVDAYDGKAGKKTLNSLIAQYGRQETTFTSTSRGKGNSRIHFYRVPPGSQFVSALPGLEIIQSSHRYALVSPSIHDKTGETYRWYYPTKSPMRMVRGLPVELPDLDNIPHMSEGLVEGLTKPKSLYNGGVRVKASNSEVEAWLSELNEGQL